MKFYDGNFYINWPDFFTDMSFDKNQVEYLIIWPDYFGESKVESSISSSFLIKWPNYLYVDGCLDVQEYCIQWPDFSLEDMTILPELLLTESHPVKIRNKTVPSSTYRFVHTLTTYDHSANLSGLQFVSGHYRKLANGNVVYVKPHRRYR